MADDTEQAAPPPPPKFTDVFSFDDIEYRVGPTNKRARDRDASLSHKGQALPYITAAAARDRLDAVHGPHWSCSYREVFVGDPKVSHVECTIVLHMPDGVDVSRADVGEGREGTGSTGDPVKTAYTDAFKRACQSFGIGRFLNALPKEWVELNEFDQFTDAAYETLRKSYDYFMDRGGRPRRRGRAATPRPAAPRQPRPSDPVIPPAPVDGQDVTDYNAVVKTLLANLHKEVDAGYFASLMDTASKKYPHALVEGRFVVSKLTSAEAKELTDVLKRAI